MDFSFTQTLEALGAPEAAEILAPHWEDSQASFPAAGLPFLDPAQFLSNRAYVGLPEELDPLLIETARRIADSPHLRRLAWHCHRLLFVHRDYPGSEIARWPILEGAIGDLAGVLYILIALPVVPLALAEHARRGVAERITRDSVSRFGELADRYRQTHEGRWGMAMRSLAWLRQYTGGELYRLGRMEFVIDPFFGDIHVYRHRATGDVVALAADGTKFDEGGYIYTDVEAKLGWTARLVVGEEKVVGCPISPRGHAINAEVELPLRDWECVLSKGDPVLAIHIPAGGGLTPELTADAMRQALEFFARYFPDRSVRGFSGASWMLNPEYDWIYRPDANMVVWQRELYLFPIASGKKNGLYFVFGDDHIDLASAPRDTSLRRAILNHLERGGRLLGGGMFFLADDFAQYGNQHYRSHWPPKALPRLDGNATREIAE